MKDTFRRNERPAPKPDPDFVVYGVQAVLEAIDSGSDINKVIVQKDLRSAAIEQVLSRCRSRRITVQSVPASASAFPPGKNHQGVVALVSPVSYYHLDELLPSLFEEGHDPLIVVLDRITDVRNFGAIARSALCAGAHALVIPAQGAAQVTDDAVKTSAGALLKIPVCREANLKTVMELLNQSGVKTVGLSEKANKQLPFLDLKGPVALILGSEEDGLSMEVLKRCGALAKIPLEKGVSSLNVSVSAGIALYEAVRQNMT
jgi:23S rRNA (guanosine2251-2'-O)-methyltransferase